MTLITQFCAPVGLLFNNKQLIEIEFVKRACKSVAYSKTFYSELRSRVAYK